MKKLTALFLAVLMVFTLAACQNNKKAEAPADESVVGSYALVSASDNGEELDLSMFPELKFTLNEDGSGVYGNGGTDIEITWAQDGETVTFTATGDGPADPLVLIANGDILVATEGTSQMTFQKQ